MGSPAEGTIYLVSIALPDQNGHMPEADYIEKAITGIGLYQTVQIDGNRMTLEARDNTGKILDAIAIEKALP